MFVRLVMSTLFIINIYTPEPFLNETASVLIAALGTRLPELVLMITLLLWMRFRPPRTASTMSDTTVRLLEAEIHSAWDQSEALKRAQAGTGADADASAGAGPVGLSVQQV